VKGYHSILPVKGENGLSDHDRPFFLIIQLNTQK
jgi:hypothetical protein